MIRVRLRLYWSPRCYPITPSCSQNVQAFIRRAPRMADKTSWTKPRARMTYGDSIVEAGGLTAGIGTAAGPWPARLRAREGVVLAGWGGAARRGRGGGGGGAGGARKSGGRRGGGEQWGRADERGDGVAQCSGMGARTATRRRRPS